MSTVTGVQENVTMLLIRKHLVWPPNVSTHLSFQEQIKNSQPPRVPYWKLVELNILILLLIIKKRRRAVGCASVS